MDLGYALLRPILFRTDPERAHRLTLRAAAALGRDPVLRELARTTYAPEPSPALEIEAFGLRFAHPLGLAAGLDKDGEAIEAWAAIGLAFLELGTVTPGAGQPGNEPPRLARLAKSRAVVNRLGFPNRGAEALARRLAGRETMIPVGANIGKAKRTPNDHALADYLQCLRAVFDDADYVAVNVSSPNTPGLRDLQSVAALRPLLEGVLAENRRVAKVRGDRPRPVLVKIAPDLADADVDAVADLALELGLDGVIATNTTSRHHLVDPPPPIPGGLSGAPLAPRALELTRQLFARLERKVPIVGVGGIMGAEDAWRRIRAGATLLQTYTGLIYEGPGLIRSVTGGLEERLEVAGLRSIGEAVGADA
jgi:dihydroorotate dehydrogenase